MFMTMMRVREVSVNMRNHFVAMPMGVLCPFRHRFLVGQSAPCGSFSVRNNSSGSMNLAFVFAIRHF